MMFDRYQNMQSLPVLANNRRHNLLMDSYEDGDSLPDIPSINKRLTFKVASKRVPNHQPWQLRESMGSNLAVQESGIAGYQ